MLTIIHILLLSLRIRPSLAQSPKHTHTHPLNHSLTNKHTRTRYFLDLSRLAHLRQLLMTAQLCRWQCNWMSQCVVSSKSHWSNEHWLFVSRMEDRVLIVVWEELLRWVGLVSLVHYAQIVTSVGWWQRVLVWRDGSHWSSQLWNCTVAIEVCELINSTDCVCVMGEKVLGVDWDSMFVSKCEESVRYDSVEWKTWVGEV